ncbi:MAG: UvrD-helicase domain-containing protein [Acidobacteria bacterium]|nr:UvrD-helicase domain-containing protein [Acidobacteriota bacterium]MBI3655689.1 UvrD-helicase domain-containing protein [Acidobacteriota bacterium]
MSISKNLTKEQLRASQTLNRHCVVIAGPGSGKTFVLVERILNILRAQDSPDTPAPLNAIAAITFTRKAANEMKARLRAYLGRLLLAAGNGTERRRWLTVLRQVESAEITTIHGLCAGILAAHPVEANIDPAFTVLDDYQCQVLKTEAAGAAVAELLESDDPSIMRLIMAYLSNGPRQELIGSLVSLYSDVRSLGLSPPAVAEVTRRYLSSMNDYHNETRELETIINEIRAKATPTEAMRQQSAGLLTEWEKGRAWIFRSASIDHAPTFEAALKSLGGFPARGRFSELVKALRAQLARVQLTFYDVCAHQPTSVFLHALKIMDEKYDRAKAYRHGLDYDDLQWKTREMLQAFPQIARRLAQRYRFLLVDEFQDTNGLQKEIIERLALAEAHTGNLFIVGDAKQSVYNFRGAEVEVFERTAQDLKARGAMEARLVENFRSVPVLVEFFNFFFAGIMQPDPGADEATAREQGFVSFTRMTPTRLTPLITEPVELLLQWREPSIAMAEAREQEAQALAMRIQELIGQRELCVSTRSATGGETARAARFSDIALLFRAMSDIKIYEHALRRAGIPYVIISGKGFYQREEIQDVISLLTFLENDTDEIALAAALRSPLFGISDESLYRLRQRGASVKPGPPVEPQPLLAALLSCGRSRLSGERPPTVSATNGAGDSQELLQRSAAEALTRLRELRDRLPLSDLLEEILRLTDFRAVQTAFPDGYQRAANLNKLVELSRRFSGAGPHFLTDFVSYVEKFNELEAREPEADLPNGENSEGGAVQIMTIHKAKGLEFPIVILPDLSRKLRVPSNKIPFDRALGIGVEVPDEFGVLHTTGLHRKIKEYVGRREWYEAQRLLFVAASRAQDYLILSGCFTPGPADAAWTTASNYMDWILGALHIGERLGEMSPDAQVYGPVVVPSSCGPIRLRVVTAAPRLYSLTEAGQPAPLVERHTEIRAGGAIEAHLATDDAISHLAENIMAQVAPLAIADELPAPLSVTEMAFFAHCPLRYYYEVIQGLPPLAAAAGATPGELTVAASELTAVRRGRSLHRFCALYTGADSVAATLENALREERIFDPALRQRWILLLHPMAERYVNGGLFQWMKRIISGQASGTVHSEYEMVYRTSGLYLRGRIDKLIIAADHQATVVELKTRALDLADAAAAAVDHRVALQLYVHMLRATARYSDIRAQIYFLDIDHALELDQALLCEEATRQLLEQLSDQMRTATRRGVYTACPAPERCRRCPCKSYCPSAESGLARPEKPSEGL